MCLMKNDLHNDCCCFCKLKLNVPNGIYTLHSSWGKDEGLLEPGAHWGFCCYKRIAVQVSKNTVRFKCPVEYVPTKDNVHVSLGVGVNFHIGSREEGNEK